MNRVQAPTIRPAPQPRVPSVNTNILTDGLRVLLGGLIAYGFAVGVIKIIDSAASNQFDDIGPFHQFLTVGTFAFGFFIIDGLFQIFFNIPSIIPFSN